MIGCTHGGPEGEPVKSAFSVIGVAAVIILGLQAQPLADERQTVAILELENQSGAVRVEEVQYIADAVRSAAAASLDKDTFQVLARESMEVLLPRPKVTCLADKCLAEIGRALQARYVIGGSLKDVGTMIGVTLQVYESFTGELVASEQGRAVGVDEVVSVVQRAALRLVGQIARRHEPLHSDREPRGVPVLTPASSSPSSAVDSPPQADSAATVATSPAPPADGWPKAVEAVSGPAFPDESLADGEPGPEISPHPWISGAVRYVWQRRTSTIGREYWCSSVPGLCPGTAKLLTLKELQASRTVHRVDLEFHGNLFRYVDLSLLLPIVGSDTTGISFAAGVSPGNSTISTAPGTGLFSVPNDGPKRLGFGDLSIGARVTPLPNLRDGVGFGWWVGLTYTAPTGKARRGDNDGVGEGVHAFRVDTELSQRASIVEPYLGYGFAARVPASDTLFRNYGPAQTAVSPPWNTGLNAGVRILPWKAPEPDRRYVSIDVGFSAVRTSAGRAYTDLFDALATSVSPLLATTRQTENPDPAPGITRSDGITEVGSYWTFTTWASIDWQPVEYLEVSFRFSYARELDHLLTNGIGNCTVRNDIEGSTPVIWCDGSGGNFGKDLDGNGVVRKNSSGANELNPVYVAAIDDPGKRLRATDINIFGILLAVTGKF